LGHDASLEQAGAQHSLSPVMPSRRSGDCLIMRRQGSQTRANSRICGRKVYASNWPILSSQPAVAKVSQPKFREKSGNSALISKGFSGNVIWRFESSKVSQPVRRLETLPSDLLEMPANCGVLRFNGRPPGTDLGHFRLGLAASLRRILEIFPFLGDRRRRPGSICTAWPSLQCNSPNPPSWPPANLECRARTAAPTRQPDTGNATVRD
jgi:hypothetical protein